MRNFRVLNGFLRARQGFLGRRFASLVLDNKNAAAFTSVLDRFAGEDEARKVFFAANRAVFDVDLKSLMKGRRSSFYIRNYNEAVLDVSKDLKMETCEARDLLDQARSEMNSFAVNYAKNLSRLGKIFDDSQFYGAKKPLMLEKSDREVFFAYPAQRIFLSALGNGRNNDSLNTKNRLLSNYCKHLVIGSLKNKALEDCIDKIGGDRTDFRLLRPDFTQNLCGAAFARDGCVVIGDRVFQASFDMLMRAKNDPKINRLLWFQLKNFAVMRNDLLENGLDTEEMPFFLEGGNVIFDKERNILFFCIPDFYFNERGHEKQALIFKNGKLCEVNHEIFVDFVKNWAKENGFAAKVIERNLFDYKIAKLYHLDTFMNLVGGYLVIYKDGVPRECFDGLQEVYGGKIIEVSQKEWQNMATNFVVIDNNVIFTSSEPNIELMGKLNDVGLNCVTPFISIQQLANDGLRCKTLAVSRLEEELLEKNR